MKNTVALILILLTGKTAYCLPAMGACESAMSTVVQKVRAYQTERRLKFVKENTSDKFKRAKVLKRLLKSNPEPSLKIQIAYLASKLASIKAMDILKELAQQDPSIELQEVIVFSMASLAYSARSWGKKAEQKAIIQFLEEWLENKELHSKMLQEIFVMFALKTRGEKGFELLERISDKYPSLKLEREFADIASAKGKSAGVDMFKKRLRTRQFSSEEQEIYAFYAGKMKGSYGLSILKLLEETGVSSIERLRFVFLAGKIEAYGSSRGYSRGGSSYIGDDGAATTGAIVSM